MVEKPASVKQRSEAADAMIRAAAQPTPEPEDDQAPAPASMPTDGGAVAEPVQVPANMFRETNDQPEPPDEDSGEPADPSANGHVDFEHRFKVMQGKYRAESKRWRDETAELRHQLQDMRNLMAVMAEQGRAQPAPAPEAAPPAAPRPLVSQKEIDEIGLDVLDTAKRFVLQDLAPQLSAIEAALARLDGRVSEASTTAKAATTNVRMNARQQMWALLDGKITDWRQVNEDEDFKEWLQQEDEMSGETRQTLLVRAYEKNDGPRVLKFFTKYKAESASGDEPEAGTAQPSRGNPAPAAAAGNGKVDPKTLVAPGRGRHAPHSALAAKIEWTPKDISRFYTDLRRGFYKDNPGEAERLEKDIFAATREGRLAHLT